MAYMGNMTTANADEINPNNFASRPGVFSVNTVTSPDYLFGSNMGLTTPNNCLNISHSKIKRSLPYPIRIGQTLTENEAANIANMIAVGGIFASIGAYALGTFSKGKRRKQLDKVAGIIPFIALPLYITAQIGASQGGMA